MKAYLGKDGLNKTWQSDFKEKTKCHKCKKDAYIMFVVFEECGEKKYVCELRKGVIAREGMWPHDAIACANYLCPNCFEVTAIINQA